MFASPDVSFVLLCLFSLLACVFVFSFVGGVGVREWVELSGFCLFSVMGFGFSVWVTIAFCFWKVFSLVLSLGETNDRVLRFFVSEEEFYLMGFSSGSRTMCPRFSTTSVQMWW
jgi:hypothetical protein